MSDDAEEQLAPWLREVARHLPYPPTPNLVAALRERRSRRPTALPAPMAGLLALLAAVCAGLLAAPQVRGAALEALRVGVVRILPAGLAPQAATSPLRPTGMTTPAPLRDLSGATTLEDARARLPFALRLPGAPDDLGPPDDVFVQNLGGPAAILAWREPGDPARVRLALYILSADVFAQKLGVEAIQETTVGDRRAVWAEGPYVLEIREGAGQALAERRLVDGNTLIWEEAGLTYRLESGLSLEAAKEVAESLR